MSQELQGTSRTVRSVAFGENFNDCFVVYEDGWWYCSGSIPNGLDSKLKARQSRADLDRVSLGPNGEWFLRARNGRSWWGGVSDLFNSDAREVMKVGGDITDIQFGESATWDDWNQCWDDSDACWFIRYK